MINLPLYREPRTENREPRTENREPRTENREPRTENRENIIAQRHLIKYQAKLVAKMPDDLPFHVAKMVKIIHDQLFLPDLSVDYVRSQLSTASNTVLTNFKQALGQSPKQYIMQKRFEACEILLQKTDLSNAEMAKMLGLGNTGKLNRLCSRFTNGKPPQIYRKLLREPLF